MRRLFYSDDEFGQAFSDKLKEHREIPSGGNWAAINSRLNQRSHKRLAPYGWAAVTIGSIFLLGVLINYSTRNERKYHLTQTEQSYLKQTYAGTTNDVKDPTTKAITQQENTTAKDIINQNNAVLGSITEIEKGNSSARNIATAGNAASDNGSDGNAVESKSKISHLISDINKSISRIDAAVSNSNVAAERNDVEIGYLAAADKNSVTSEQMIPSQSVSDVDEPLLANNADAKKIVYLITKDCSSEALKFYLGIAGFAQHTYLLSSTILKSPRYKYRFSPGYALGIVTGYNILPRLAIESGIMLSNENQNYSSSEQNPKLPNIEVKSNTEWVTLNYLRIPLLAKYKIPTSGNKCVSDESINIIGGIDYGRFIGGRTYNAVSAYNLTTNYVKANDLQFVVGAERSKALSKHIVFNGGVRFAYSSSQISELHSLRINEIYKPHNFDSAITLSLSYR